MLRRITIDQFMCERENISANASIVFDVISKLSNHSFIHKVTKDEKTYTILYKKMILMQIPHFKISSRTLTDALNELETVGLVECINKFKAPAYRMTAKADEYIFLTSYGSIEVEQNKPQTKEKSTTQLFSLGKKTRFDKLTKEYVLLLQEKVKEFHKKEKINDSTMFPTFIDFHTAKGNAFVNWMSAYKNWYRNSLKWGKNQKSNGGGYSGDGASIPTQVV